MGSNARLNQSFPVVDEALVDSFLKQHLSAGDGGSSPGINFNTIKSWEIFQFWTYAKVKAWFKARPQRYVVMGQLVLPIGVVAKLHSSASGVGDSSLLSSSFFIPPPSRVPKEILRAIATPPPSNNSRSTLHSCLICRVNCTSAADLRAHFRGQRHAGTVATADASALEEAVKRLAEQVTSMKAQSSGGSGDGGGPAVANRILIASQYRSCELCSKWFPRPELYQQHVSSAAHRARVFWLLLRADPQLAPLGSSAPAAPAAAQPAVTHAARPGHHPAVPGAARPTPPTAAPTPGAPRPRVTVSTLPSPLPPLEPGATASHPITLTNNGPGPLKLTSVRFLSPLPHDDVSMTLQDAEGVTAQPVQADVMVPEGQSYTVNLVLAPKELGLMRNLVVFECDRKTAVPVPVAASCCPADIPPPPPPLPPPEQGTRRGTRQSLMHVKSNRILKGIPPPGLSESAPSTVPVLHLHPDEDLRAAVERSEWSAVRRMIPSIQKVETLPQYVAREQLLLGLEELQHEIDVQMYNMRGVTLDRAGRSGFLELAVPGLAENRPSVLKGDRLLVSEYNEMEDGVPRGLDEYEGYVHAVEKETVRLRFADSFHQKMWVQGRRFNVRFTVNRSVFNLMQNALMRCGDPAAFNPHLLLPGRPIAPLPRRSPDDLPLIEPPGGDTLGSKPAGSGRLRWQDTKLNDEQKLAVREVVRGEHHPLPYIIYGPPGTGKTSTLVEAARQLLLTNSSARLLLVAPSNSAADQLMTTLIAPPGAARSVAPSSRFGPGGCLVTRLCAYSRPFDDLSPGLWPLAKEHGLMLVGGRTRGGGGGDDGFGTAVCAVNWDERAGAFLLPPLEMLMVPRLRVVVTTCSMAARLVHMGVPSGHFSHVLMDEAGHAEEPLALCALAGLAGKATRVVMAGDPRQLGPVILSMIARQRRLDVSLMERLLGQADGPYSRRAFVPPGRSPYPSAYVTKLLLNYRSHPAILCVPNSAFYHNELRAAAPLELVNQLLLWEGLPNNRVPILMHHLVGKDEQEANSPSWQNVLEARQVVEYVKKLLDNRKRGRITAADIGIISPYKKQVQRIRVQLKELAMHIKVGSVEEFQGQERTVIIVSTVRSSDEYMDFDCRHRLGFLANPKRFNVAITRAKALLVVVGNAQILVHDPHWRALLRYLASMGAIVGQKLSPDLAARLAGPPEGPEGEEWADEEEGGYGAAGGGTGMLDVSRWEDALADVGGELPLAEPVVQHEFAALPHPTPPPLPSRRMRGAAIGRQAQQQQQQGERQGRGVGSAGDSDSVNVDLLASTLARLVLKEKGGWSVEAPKPEEYLAMMNRGAVAHEGGEMRRYD